MPQDHIQKAIKGSQEAMRALYDAHKSKVMCLCQALLVDENEADHATAYIFRKAFEEVAAGRIATDKEFAVLIVRKAVLHCRAKFMKTSNRAFRVPTGSNFAYTYEPLKMDFSGKPEKIILRNLPAFPRFIYVLHYAADYSAAEIAKTFNTTPKVIEKAMDAEPVNIERIAAAADKNGTPAAKFSVEKFHDMLMRDVSGVKVPTSVDAAVRMNIEEICKPIMKREKQKRTGIIAGIAAALVIVGIVIGVTAGGGENSDVDLDNADLDTTISTSTDENSDGTSEVGGSELDDLTDSIVDDELYFETTHYADIKIENYGTITVALAGNAVPETVSNFVSLAEEGFYDGLTFHRIMDGFMMQGGDPNGDGTGGNTDAEGNEVNITGEFADNGFENNISHTRGTISMARSNDYDSASSQFFIVHEDSDFLDGQYAAFGLVTEGMDIVDAICGSAEPTDGNGTIAVEDQPVITSITIRKASEVGTGNGADEVGTAYDETGNNDADIS